MQQTATMQRTSVLFLPSSLRMLKFRPSAWRYAVTFGLSMSLADILTLPIPAPSLSPSRRQMETQTTTCSSSITTSAFSEWFSASNVDMASSSSHNRSFSFSRSSCKADSSSLSRSVVLLRFSCSVFSSSCTRSRHWSRCGTCLERWSLRGLGIEIS
jgi:hypothetical protein